MQASPQPPHQSQQPTYLPNVQQLVPTLTSVAPSTPAPYASALAMQANMVAGRWPANREVERTIPQIHVAENTETIKLPLGLRHFVAHEAVILERAIQARETTYGGWYQRGSRQSPSLWQLEHCLFSSLRL